MQSTSILKTLGRDIRILGVPFWQQQAIFTFSLTGFLLLKEGSLNCSNSKMANFSSKRSCKMKKFIAQAKNIVHEVQSKKKKTKCAIIQRDKHLTPLLFVLLKYVLYIHI